MFELITGANPVANPVTPNADDSVGLLYVEGDGNLSARLPSPEVYAAIDTFRYRPHPGYSATYFACSKADIGL